MSPYADSSASRDKNTRHCCMLTPARQEIKNKIPLRAEKIILIARANSESFDAMLGCPPTTRGARSPDAPRHPHHVTRTEAGQDRTDTTPGHRKHRQLAPRSGNASTAGIRTRTAVQITESPPMVIARGVSINSPDTSIRAVIGPRSVVADAPPTRTPPTPSQPRTPPLPPTPTPTPTPATKHRANSTLAFGHGSISAHAPRAPAAPPHPVPA